MPKIRPIGEGCLRIAREAAAEFEKRWMPHLSGAMFIKEPELARCLTDEEIAHCRRRGHSPGF
jgi:hypothetical protein